MNRKDLTIIGHRGGSSKNGENNLDVFKQGFRNGADLIECDLNISKDDVIFIYHDPYVKINGKSIETKKLLYRDLLSSKPDICSLENLFENLGEKLYVFELKDESNYKKIIDIFEFKYKEQFIKNRFISFSAEALRYVKSKNKNIYCSYLGTSLRGNK